MTTTENTEIRPFTITIPEAALEDLRTRLDRTRFPEPAPGDGWEYGTPTSYLRDMVERWKSFDWRAQEARMNAVPNFLTEIDGQTVHFVHVRSAPRGRDAAAAPAHLPGLVRRVPGHDRPADRPGGARRPAEDDFHVVIPSMPGFGFSTPVVDGGWTMARVARTYDALMRRLGYASYGAHGSDGGAMVSPRAGGARTRRASWVRTCCSCSPSRPATRPSSRSSGRRSTPRWSSSAGSSRSAATTR